MWNAERVVAELRRRGELRESGPGLTALRGEALALYRGLEAELRSLALESTPDEWLLPPAIEFETLARADYFASFPQWLTAAAHMSSDETRLEQVATAADPAAAARAALEPASVALQPALCFHVHATFAGTVLASSERVTCQGTCWRHERERHAPLERGWAFRMREIVCLGGETAVSSFLAGQRVAVVALAERLGLQPQVEPASDPFFAPTSRGRALLQRMKLLKEELLVPLGDGRRIAAASFNHHERFFGECFAIRLPDGTPALSGCVAFGLERWLLAVLVAHGLDSRNWPELDGLRNERRLTLLRALQEAG
jgi:seryl-tRNA synthetase